MEKLVSYAKKQKTETLMEGAALLMDVHTEEASLSFVAILNVLEERLPEAEFVEFCDGL